MKNKTLVVTEKVIYSFEVSWINCEIVKWKKDWMEKEITNSYIYIHRKNIWNDFDNLILNPIKRSYGWYGFNYMCLDDYFDFHWGITYYEKIYNELWEVIWIKVWNDYNHIWNWWETDDEIYRHVKSSVESFISHFPEYLVWNPEDWKYIKYEDIDDK